jgi:hypothetical protein
MDCRTARSLLDFARPRSAELHPSEADALDSHLNGCPECDALFRHERQIDEHLAQAVRDVPIPEGLRDRLLARLATQRRRRLRRLVLNSAALAAAAAVLLALGVWGWQEWARPPLLRPDLVGAHHEAVEQALTIDQIKLPTTVTTDQEPSLPDIQPGPLNARWLAWYGPADFQGRSEPMFLFVATDKPSLPVLRVYVLSGKKYDLNALGAGSRISSQGYTLETYLDRSRTDVGYILIFPDSEGLKPFLVGTDGGPG